VAAHLPRLRLVKAEGGPPRIGAGRPRPRDERQAIIRPSRCGSGLTEGKGGADIKPVFWEDNYLSSPARVSGGPRFVSKTDARSLRPWRDGWNDEIYSTKSITWRRGNGPFQLARSL